ncbi:UNVERIFIED_CONTAM: hypothetical protein Sradi_2520100 [Sesamum radiatum]|uniref:Uncharacterized protein n=1 Tax=Sesamum radiatum TaxID=300843 RepID=A0AAW2SMJ0_SESRA
MWDKTGEIVGETLSSHFVGHPDNRAPGEASSIRRELESMAAHEETVCVNVVKTSGCERAIEILGSFTAGLVRGLRQIKFVN